jgi:hypothetical protein
LTDLAPSVGASEPLLEALVVQLSNYGRYGEARAAADRLLRDFGEPPGALLGLARIEEEAAHDLAAARRYLEAALRKYPKLIPCHLAYLTLLIKAGEWPDATRHLRSMMRYFGYRYPRFAGAPNWDGTPLEGKTVLLDSTLATGYGDYIHFVRFAQPLRERGAKVGVRTRKGLESLLATAPGIDFVSTRSAPAPTADYTCEMSLVWLFLGLGMEEVRYGETYLRPPANTLPAPREGPLRVGLARSSADRRGFNRYTAKNVPAQELAPLADLPDVQFVSFEMPSAQADLRQVFQAAPFEEAGPRLSNFFETAAALSQLDVLVTVDTAVAHLAGALGKPAFLLLPFSPEWRWLLKREDTPWYSSVRLIRQATPGDWAPVIKRCAEALLAYRRF